MSWRVETLLRNRNKIRLDAEALLTNNDVNITVGHRMPTDDSLDSFDDFNDLLLVEKCIKELSSAGMLSQKDLYIINAVSGGDPIVSTAMSVKMGRLTFSKKFKDICNRISYVLGGPFSDDGFVDELAIRCNLTEEETRIAKDYMKGRFRHKLLRNKKT